MNLRFLTKLPLRFAFKDRPYRVDLTQSDYRFIICIRESSATRTQTALNISARFADVSELNFAAGAGFELLPYDQESDVGRLVGHLVESGLAVAVKS